MPPSRPSRATPEALRALRERLEATQKAAQRLAEDAASASSSKPPPSGWDVPHSAERANEELDALVSLLGTLRDLLPPELRAQLAELARQLLVFIRAVLDWWIAKLESGPRGDDTPVEDIPIS
jgi:uncharacterized protein (DUF2267 family)